MVLRMIRRVFGKLGSHEHKGEDGCKNKCLFGVQNWLYLESTGLYGE